MIFVTVGSQLAFDRMTRVVDEWAGTTGNGEVFAQIGPNALKPRNLEWREFVDPAEFRRRTEEADVLVAHAGMGSILTAMQVGKPIVIMPRRGDLGETRNDHQRGTAERFRQTPGVYVASDESELRGLLGQIGELRAGEVIGPWASDLLLDAVRKFIAGEAW